MIVEEGTKGLQYFNMTGAVNVGGMEIEEGPIVLQYFNKAGAIHGKGMND